MCLAFIVVIRTPQRVAGCVPATVTDAHNGSGISGVLIAGGHRSCLFIEKPTNQSASVLHKGDRDSRAGDMGNLQGPPISGKPWARRVSSTLLQKWSFLCLTEDPPHLLL